jgi:hypothetical protein
MAKTHDEIFQRWKDSNPGERFRDYWKKRWDDELEAYFSLGWELIPVRQKDKQPQRAANWKTDRFPYDVIRWHVLQRGNVAVNAGESGIIVLDYDSKEVPRELFEMLDEMPVIDTAKGYAFITKPPFEGATFDRLQARFKDFDSPRGEGKYELVPLSETCAVPKHDTKDATCPPHDFRVREWCGRGLSNKIPEFNSFVESVLR